MKFRSLDVALLYISINLRYIHVWNTVVTSAGLVPLVANWIVRQAAKTNMQGCWSFTCAASLEPLAHHQCGQLNSSLSYRHYFGRCSPELARLVPLPFSQRRSTRYSDRLHDFNVTIHKDVFLHTARLWNSLLSIE